MECVLLQKAQTDNSGNFQSQLLIIRQNVAADQLYDLHQTAFLVQDRYHLISVINKIRAYIICIPARQIGQVFAVAGQPVDRREMTGICQVFIQPPEAADETFRILGNGFRKIAALRRYRTDDRNTSFSSV